ncbi:MAG: P-loop NTPase [Armatimonadia bacterium]|nr:P-loop NTPase [Armatimonadia bacterium]
MNDQAAGLRVLAYRKRHDAAVAPAGGSSRVVCITSGKGGVGKTNLAANLGILLSQRGNRVILLDADLGLANLDMVMGISPRLTLEHLIRGEVADIKDIVLEGPEGVRIVAGGSGIRELANISQAGLDRLLNGFIGLQDLGDLLLMDTGAGIQDSVMGFVQTASEVIIVTTPEPTAMADAYAIIKIVAAQQSEAKLSLIANMCRGAEDGRAVLERLSLVSNQFLGVRLRSLGWIPRDERVVNSVRRREPFVVAYPSSPATRSLEEIADTLSLSASRTRSPAQGLAAAVERLRMAFSRGRARD